MSEAAERNWLWTLGRALALSWALCAVTLAEHGIDVPVGSRAPGSRQAYCEGAESRLAEDEARLLYVRGPATKPVPADISLRAQGLNFDVRLEKTGCEDGGSCSPTEMREAVALLKDLPGKIEKLHGTAFPADYYGGGAVDIVVTCRQKGGRDNDWSHVYGGYYAQCASEPKPAVFFPCQLVREGKVPFFHEMTHLYLWDTPWLFLREGIADLSEAKLGSGKLDFFSKSAHDVFKETDSAQRAKLLEQVTVPTVNQPKSKPERRAYYQLAHSFATYVWDTYGRDSLRQLLRAGFFEVSGKNGRRSFSDLLKEWQKFGELEVSK